MEELINDLLRLERNTQKIILKGLNSILAVQEERIHRKGLAGDGGKIGKYSTNPVSISKKNQARNTGQTYFPGGYAEYKRKIGFSGGSVNLENTGQMKQDYSVIPLDGGGGLGFKNPKNADKSEYVEDHFKKDIYVPTKQEEELFDKIINFEIDKILKTR